MIQSNIGSVLERTNRLRHRDIPRALERAVAPSAEILKLARHTAEQTLLAVSDPGQRQFIAPFVETVTMMAFGKNGFALKMHNPAPAPTTLAEFQGARAAVSPADLDQNLFRESVSKFESMMTDWVVAEKRKDARDAGKTDEEIGQFIAYLMLTPNPTPKELEARGKLMPHIVDFIQRQQTKDQPGAAVTATWLRAVLVAWRELFRRYVPERFRMELRAARAELAI